ncbi:hypothetical protein K2224_07825 [Streptomyces sp. BHT-5-2]|uniref:hypothetical protein n=1 Tax=unclassified Streptomyces TaxID=2593676 RepID=UPI001C8EA0E2|nr:hypothetical protein [Streptomyces sp. BHT-5-2]QZL03128.1 hypothetical protein K2224_07825 [Streptomyces sp. BHT-5-2]
MTTYDAQAALDAIRERQEQTREQYVRQNYSGAQGLITALVVFAIGSAVDLPSPWSLVGRIVAAVLMVGGVIIQCRRTRVRRRQTGAEKAFTALAVAVVLTVFVAAVVVARLMELPAPSVPAAGVAAVATLVVTYATRPIAKRLARREGRG